LPLALSTTYHLPSFTKGKRKDFPGTTSRSSKLQKMDDRAHFHSKSYTSIRPDEPLVESEDEPDVDWLHEKSDAVILLFFFNE